MTEYLYTTARDGSEIAYRMRGGSSDGPALVFTNGYTTSDFYWKHLIARLSEAYPEVRLITWDLKGHGRSGPARSMDAVGIEDSADDLRRVMDAAGVERAALLGFSLGCQIVLESWRHFSDRIDALVPILGTYGRPFDNLVVPQVGAAIHAFLKHVGRRVPGPMLKGAFFGTRLPMIFEINKLAGMIGRRVSREDMQPFFDHFGMLHGPTWAAMGLAAQRHSAEDLLDAIHAPTLIVAGGGDTFTPPRLGRIMHERISDSELLYLEEATHTGLFEYPDVIGDTLESFLLRHGLLGEPSP